MELTFEQIMSAMAGAVTYEVEDGVLYPRRFTEEQAAVYQDYPFYLRNSKATAGMRFSFETNSRVLDCTFRFKEASSRSYYSFDVFVNDRCVGFIDNFSDKELPVVYCKTSLSHDEKKARILLGGGTKKVTIYMPYTVSVGIVSVSLDDESSFTPVRRNRRYISFGDSITHGYDALRPSSRYPARIADILGAEEVCKGIGGERFNPGLAAMRDPFEPDYITVAYGTNDWSNLDRPTVEEKCRAFYENLRALYPNAKIFALLPIWRKDTDNERKFGPFSEIGELIRTIVETIPNITVIDCFPFVPQDSNYFADQFLHPNDSGFDAYVDGLIEALRPYI